jgi:FtsZ-binding cell division protein ZapB
VNSVLSFETDGDEATFTEDMSITYMRIGFWLFLRTLLIEVWLGAMIVLALSSEIGLNSVTQVLYRYCVLIAILITLIHYFLLSVVAEMSAKQNRNTVDDRTRALIETVSDLQNELNGLRGVSDTNVRLNDEYHSLQMQLGEVHDHNELLREENLRLQDNLNSAIARTVSLRDQLRSRIQAQSQVAGAVSSPTDDPLYNLRRNFPQNAKYLLANAHPIDPSIHRTKQGRPDRRYKQGKSFSIFSSEVAYVLHEGRRVCVMLETVAERP